MSLGVVDIRHFSAHDFELLLDAEARAWDAALHWDYTPSRRLIATCLDEKRLTGYALVNGARLAGYSYYFCEGEKGLLGNLFVSPSGPQDEPVRLLLENVLETLLATPGLRRAEAQLPLLPLEDVEPCFAAHGFDAFLRRFMIVPLVEQVNRSSGTTEVNGPRAIPRNSLPDGFRLEPWDRKHFQDAAALLYYGYRRHVDAQINDQYASLEGTLRLIENIAQNRGCGEPIPEGSLVSVHKASDKMAGFLAVTTVRPATAHIPQIAVAEEFRSLGLGRAMLSEAFQALQRRGFQEVSLTVTDQNAGAVRLYERLGFETCRTFGGFSWTRH